MNNKHSLSEKIKRLIEQNSHGFIGSVIVLVSGTALGHAITSLALLFLTRLYTPEQFGILAIFTSILSIISVISCLRLEIAIPIAQDEETLTDLIFLSLISLFVFFSILSILVFFIPVTWVQYISNGNSLYNYLWLLPIGFFWTGLYGIIQNLAIRENFFLQISKSRVIQSGSSASFQISGGLINPTATGLIIGFLLNVVIGSLFLGRGIYSRRKQLISRLKNVRVTYATLKYYDKYPKYSTWEAFANSAAIQAPVVMIGILSSKSESGYLLLAMSVIQAPMSLFGTSIGQVYFSKAPNELKNHNLGRFTLSIFGKLIKVGVGPLIFIGILSPIIFEFIFGQSWIKSGWLVLFMTPWFIMQFLSTPISMAIHITGHQKQIFMFQIFGLILRCGSVWLASKFLLDQISVVYALSGFIFYFLYICLIFFCVDAKWQDIAYEVKNNMKISLCWTFVALLLVSIYSIFIV